MSPPSVRVNTFLEERKGSTLDAMSKIYIIFELVCGINRLYLFGKLKPVCFAISVAFSFSINILVIYLTCVHFKKDFGEFVRILKTLQYCICAILALAFRRRLNLFFSELNKIDAGTGFYKANKEAIISFRQISISVGFICTLMVLFHLFGIFESYGIEITIIIFINIAELHFFGHMLSLLVPRLRFINHLMKQSLCNRSGITTLQNELVCVNETKNSPIDMKTLMNFYHRIIIAFDMLYEAIKWQMLIIFVTSFITSLSISYNVTLKYIRDDYLLIQLLMEGALAASEIIPMFTPCRIVDAVHGEARCLIELLSTRLYENKIEKSSRAVAQAFLALMEARDLSFSLLRIFDIDVSFPFKFLGLLITYLIILLQFEKVIYLDKPTP